MIKTLMILGALLLVFVGGGVYVSTVRQSASTGKWGVETTSPDGNYLILVEGKTSAPSRPYYSHGDHEAVFSLFKQGNPIVTHESLYGGDEYDDLFLDLYPTYEWFSGNIVRFGKKNTMPQSQQDEVLVSNNTDEHLKYIRVNLDTPEIFIIADLPPKGNIHFYAQPQTDQQSDFSGITCVTRSEGPYIMKRAEFNIRGKYKGQAHYFIRIEDSDMKINSQEFELMK